jgi:hypothetical protein
MIQNLYAKTRLKKKVAQGIDLDAERHKIAQLFNKALRQANLGQWTGSSLKGNNILVFFFVVNDEIQGTATIRTAFDGYEHRSFFHDLQILRM